MFIKSIPLRTPVNLSLLLFLVVLTPGCVTSGSPSSNASRTYTNPVFAEDVPDPSVKKLGDYYYTFGTTADKRLADGRIFTVLRSHDLVNWEKLGGALVPPSTNMAYQYWAPEITEDHGRYFLYYAMGIPEDERFGIRVAVSDQPQGPFTDSGVAVTECESNRFTIDPFPFRDDDGRWYLFYACDFGYDSPGLHAGTGIAADHLYDHSRLGCDSQTIVRASHDWTLYQSNRWMSVFHNTFNWHTMEGPCVVKHDGKYYCFYSGANWTTTRYGVDYVVADSPLGPYIGAGDHARVLHGIPGAVRGPGGISIVTGPDGKTQYLLYHAWNAKMTERQLCLDRLDWTPDGPSCTPTVTPQPVP